MGRDKRFLELGGRTLLERTLAVLESLFAEVIVVVAEPASQLAGLRHRQVVAAQVALQARHQVGR